MGAVLFALGALWLGFVAAAVLARQGWWRPALAVVAALAALDLGLALAGQRLDGMRGLAMAAVMTLGGLPALAGAAIGTAVGTWGRRRRHGA